MSLATRLSRVSVSFISVDLTRSCFQATVSSSPILSPGRSIARQTPTCDKCLYACCSSYTSHHMHSVTCIEHKYVCLSPSEVGTCCQVIRALRRTGGQYFCLCVYVCVSARIRTHFECSSEMAYYFL